MSAEENNGDEELAPMVDGLSGALCILILVSTVFMLSGTDSLVTSDGGALKFRDSFTDLSKNTIYYSGAVSLSSTDLYQTRKHLIDSGKKKITFYGAVSESIENYKAKNTFNLLKIYTDLKLPSDIEVDFREGNVSQCGKNLSCIYWSY
ncbi:MAG TPA: hypothetical protein DFK21_01585 [Salmonella bongori]|uniref:Membrane protein n=3 Tax=Salmonella bongori TaxID=54736 RepID=A0A0K0HHA6_SALBC|nr:hypothetical protein [Salmonella bongori]EGE4656390.1 hypothetical protein [Salmonella bongori serovar 40:z35:- str. 95-0123]ASG56311.1 hypothetical protein LFZ56_19800 [Salmonella bongori serovar 66:z41:- str. SA19983605]ECC8734369.1 hypothetical protein [Salmonella bongori]ECC9752895.1 hypothetical protein [Salmonella bongori]ECE6548402.1 hypothetical protein [Salmonella bongori]